MSIGSYYTCSFITSFPHVTIYLEACNGSLVCCTLIHHPRTIRKARQNIWLIWVEGVKELPSLQGFEVLRSLRKGKSKDVSSIFSLLSLSRPLSDSWAVAGAEKPSNTSGSLTMLRRKMGVFPNKEKHPMFSVGINKRLYHRIRGEPEINQPSQRVNSSFNKLNPWLD